MKKILAVLLLVSAAACTKTNSPTGPTTPTTTATKIIGLSGNLAFGGVTVGQSGTATLTITNSGTATLTVSSMTVSGGLSAVTTASWTNGAIAAGQTQLVSVQFAPTAAQDYTGTLVVNGDQTSGLNSIAISGTGVVAKANIGLSGGTGFYTCSTGLCTSFTYPIINTGPGCATNVKVITRFFGANGNGPQLGIDVPMAATGGQNLSTILFRVGTIVNLQNTTNFNDIRSAQTVFRVFATWTDVACS